MTREVQALECNWNTEWVFSSLYCVLFRKKYFLIRSNYFSQLNVTALYLPRPSLLLLLSVVIRGMWVWTWLTRKEWQKKRQQQQQQERDLKIDELSQFNCLRATPLLACLQDQLAKMFFFFVSTWSSSSFALLLVVVAQLLISFSFFCGNVSLHNSWVRLFVYSLVALRAALEAFNRTGLVISFSMLTSLTWCLLQNVVF